MGVTLTQDTFRKQHVLGADADFFQVMLILPEPMENLLLGVNQINSVGKKRTVAVYSFMIFPRELFNLK